MGLPINNSHILKITKENRKNTILSIEDKAILNSMDQDNLDETASYACENGDLEVLTYISTAHHIQKKISYYPRTHKIIKLGLDSLNYYFKKTNSIIEPRIYDGLSLAAYNGHLPIIQFLLYEFQYKFTQQQLRDALYEACRNNHLSIIKLLFEHPLVENNLTYEIINNKNGYYECQFLHIAVATEAMDVINYFIEEKLEHIEDHIKYLINSALSHQLENEKLISYLYHHEKTKKHIDTETNNYDLIKKSCQNGFLVDVKFLLETDLRHKISVNINEGELFILAHEYFINTHNQSLIEYLIFEQNIIQTSTITNYLKSLFSDNSALKMFEKRDLLQTLNENLTVSETKQKTNKL